MRLTRPLILASASPRRADLLTQIGLSFEISVAHTDEPAPRPGVNLRAWAENTAAQKAIALLTLSTLRKPSLILAADTAVLVSVKYDPAAPLLDGEPMRVLGKPKDRAEAEAMLRLLSGREHTVLTSFALLAIPERKITLDTAETRVRFRQLNSDEITDYIASGEPLDKAGAYGIQGRGAVLIADITGDYNTVVGLPLTRIWEALRPWRSCSGDVHKYR